MSRCPGLGSEGKEGDWYLVSRARWLLKLPAPNTYLPIAAAPCPVYFFSDFTSLCCQDGDREVLPFSFFPSGSTWQELVECSRPTRHTFGRFFLDASSTSLWRCTSLQRRSAVHGSVAAGLFLWLYPMIRTYFWGLFSPLSCRFETNNTYIYIRPSFDFRDSVRSFFLSRPKYAIRGTGILGQIASFERRLRGAAPTPLARPCVRSAHRRERGRMPSEISEKLQKYRMSRRNSGRFWLYLMSAAPG